MRHRGGRLRLGYRHTVLAPVSTSNSIIFAVNRETGKFEFSHYNPSMTKGAISYEEIANLLQELEPMVKPIFNSPVISFLKWYQKIHPFVVIAVMISWILLIVFGTRENDVKIYIVIPAIAGTFLAWIVIVLLINCIAVGNIKDLMEESKHKIMSYIQPRNQSMRGKGYFWVVPTRFPYWLELWVEGAPMQAVSMEQQYGIPIRQEVPYYYPASNQVSPLMQSP